jgi:anionic cell wall polymer biosynthesis LytR-Cps2A-Psr (LCP) family protein
MEMQEQQQQFMTAVLGEIKNISKVSNQLQITAPKEDYFSLLAYCSLHNIKTNRSELALHGKELRKLTLDKNMDLKKIPDERWGSVNSYPVEVLNEYFAV